MCLHLHSALNSINQWVNSAHLRARPYLAVQEHLCMFRPALETYSFLLIPAPRCSGQLQCQNQTTIVRNGRRVRNWFTIQTSSSKTKYYKKIIFHNALNIFCIDSDAAEHLETEKKTARNKGEARRKKFQAQDSVLNESLNASQAGSETSKLFNFIKFLL